MGTKRDKRIIERMFLTEYARKRPGLWGQTELVINRKIYSVFNNGHYAFACDDDFGYKRINPEYQPAEKYFKDFREGIKNGDYVEVHIPVKVARDYISGNKERKTDYSLMFYCGETPVGVNPIYLRDMDDFVRPKSIWMSRRDMKSFVCYDKPLFFWNPGAYRMGLLLPRNVGVQVNQVYYSRIFEYIDGKVHIIENMYAEKLTAYYEGLLKAEKFAQDEVRKYIEEDIGRPEGVYSLLICVQNRIAEVEKFMSKKIGMMS